VDPVYTLTLLLATGVLWIVLHPLVIYPCRLKEWRYAFGSEHQALRGELRAAAVRLGTLQRRARRIRNTTKRQSADVDSRTRETVQALRRKRDALLSPDRGDRLAGEGRLELYERRLVFLKEPQGDELAVEDLSMPLSGLTITSETSSGRIFVTAEQQGDHHTAVYPETREVEVRHLCDAISSAAHKEGIASTEREDEAARITSEIQGIEKEAKSRKAEFHSTQEEQIEALRPETEQAANEFDVRCAEWEKETGRRPHPQWCRWSRWWWPW
jgi:hypothetical protein